MGAEFEQLVFGQRHRVGALVAVAVEILHHIGLVVLLGDQFAVVAVFHGAVGGLPLRVEEGDDLVFDHAQATAVFAVGRIFLRRAAQRDIDRCADAQVRAD